MPVVTLILTKPPAALRGQCRRWLLEASPGVFVGRCPRPLLEYILDAIRQCGCSALVIAGTNNTDWGIKVLALGPEAQRKLVDLDGLQLVARKAVAIQDVMK